jgi:DNA topoisomerase-1
MRTVAQWTGPDSRDSGLTTHRRRRETETMSDEKITAYCLKCKTKQEMLNPEPVFSRSGRPGTKGTCPECGAGIYKAGETPAHAALPKPEVTKSTRKRRKRARTGKRLVIVESPAKARTVGRFLGKGYSVKASIGHVRDLLRSRMSVDVDNDFEPTYRVPKEKREVVNELREEVKEASEVFLATDPDREGEAIAWHLVEAARIPEGMTKRVVFHEITKGAVAEAFAHPREMNMELINAQQARRILDRLVGYSISPLLWKNVRSRLSAGRVQSVALRLIVDREREIQAFVPVEYWSIEAELARQAERKKKKRQSFVAKLTQINGEKADLKNQGDTQKIVDDLEGAAYVVESVKKRERRRRPSAPFTTSTMQQQSSRRLGFTARRTMANAQGLYEGAEIGDEGPVGLITYMRTDSVNVAEVAQQEARAFIEATYGADYLPPEPPKYKTRAKSAQEAHEAIRPTSVLRTPEIVKPHVPRDQYRLYRLIWSRFVASQMAPAVLDTTSVGIKAGSLERPEALQNEAQRETVLKRMPYLFRVSGSVIKFPGFLKVYDDDRGKKGEQKGEEQRIPPLDEGELLDLLELLPEQHFTQPPPRYSDASLIRTLEEFGIGRPSTYAPIISTIMNRGYVERVDRRLFPTELAFIVNDLVVEHFPDIVDTGFTAQMEQNLDLIAGGDADWVKVLRDFYGPFHESYLKAEKTMENVELPPEETGELCEKCGKPMIVKWGRYGKFIACSGFPDCRNTKSYMVRVGVKCPECADGELVERRTRRGRVFFGCNTYPECEFAVWNRPLSEPCPECGGLLTQAGKDKAKCTKCETVFELEDVEKPQETEPEAAMEQA